MFKNLAIFPHDLFIVSAFAINCGLIAALSAKYLTYSPSFVSPHHCSSPLRLTSVVPLLCEVSEIYPCDLADKSSSLAIHFSPKHQMSSEISLLSAMYLPMHLQCISDALANYLFILIFGRFFATSDYDNHR